VNINREELQKEIDMYLAELDDHDKDEWYGTSRERADYVMEAFMTHLFLVEDQEAVERELYEELHKKYGPPGRTYSQIG